MGVPSHGFRGVLEQLAKELRPWVPVVSLVKGLEQGTNYRMSQIVDEVLPGHPAGILAGPNIAREVAEGYAAAAVLAMPDQHLAANLANLFRTKRFRTYTTDDVVGVEMAGALKNVYAIAVGMGYALGIGENTRALVMARAVNEMSKLGEAMGGKRETFSGLAGMGDLIVTCTSQRSRNRHVGEQLGSGKTDRRDHRGDEPGRRGRQGRQRDHGVRREVRHRHADRPRGRRRRQPRRDRRGRLPWAGRREARPRSPRLRVLAPQLIGTLRYRFVSRCLDGKGIMEMSHRSDDEAAPATLRAGGTAVATAAIEIGLLELRSPVRTTVADLAASGMTNRDIAATCASRSRPSSTT